MAVAFDEEDKVAAPKAAPKSTDAGPFAGAGTPFDMLALVGQGAALGPDIDKFLEEIVGQLNKNAKAIIGTEVRVVRLQKPMGTHAFVAGDNAVVLLFENMLGPDLPNYQPKSSFIGQAFEALKVEVPGTVMLAAPIVSPQDYARVSNWASYIIRCLAVEMNPRLNTTFNKLKQGNPRYIVDYDLQTALSMENQYSPHSVRPRANIGLTVRLSKNGLNAFGGNFQNGPEDAEPLISIVGYVDWIRCDSDPQTNQHKFWPEAKITAITSPVPFKGMVPLALAIWSSAFVTEGRWRNQYMTFGDRAPNIGHLLDQTVTKDNKIFSVKDLSQRDQIINSWTYPPVASLAVVEGQARIPSISDFSDTSLNEKAVKHIAEFFEITPPAGTQAFVVSNIEYIGTIGQMGGVLEDSRNIDYLHLMASEGAQNEQSRRLLMRSHNPVFRAEVVAQKTGTFRSLYQEHTAVIERGLIAWLSQLVSTMGLQSNQVVYGSMDQSFLQHQNQAYSQISQPSVFSPMGRTHTAQGTSGYYGR